INVARGEVVQKVFVNLDGGEGVAVPGGRVAVIADNELVAESCAALDGQCAINSRQIAIVGPGIRRDVKAVAEAAVAIDRGGAAPERALDVNCVAALVRASQQ